MIADVGQGSCEEVDYEPAGQGGRNYGWSYREGAHDNVEPRPAAFTAADRPHLGIQPHGGRVHHRRLRVSRDALGAAYAGRYFYGDFISSRVWSVALTVDPSTRQAVATDLVEHTAELGGSAALSGISSFGVDAFGELYIVSYSGSVLQIISSTTTVPSAPTGLRVIR